MKSTTAALLLAALQALAPSAAQVLREVWKWQLYDPWVIEGPRRQSTALFERDAGFARMRPLVLGGLDGSVAAVCPPDPDASLNGFVPAPYAAKLTASGTPLRSSKNEIFRQSYPTRFNQGRVLRLAAVRWPWAPTSSELAPGDQPGAVLSELQPRGEDALLTVDSDGTLLQFSRITSAGMYNGFFIFRSDADFRYKAPIDITVPLPDHYPAGVPPLPVPGGHVLYMSVMGQGIPAPTKLAMVSPAGVVLWSVSIPTVTRSGTRLTQDAAGAHVYLIAGSTFTAVRVADGTTVWTRPPGGSAAAAGYSTPVTPDGKVAVLWDDRLELLDPSAQAVVWTYPFTPRALQDPVLDPVRGQVYVVSAAGDLIALSLATGAAAWTQPVPDTVAADPALLPDGHLLLCTTSSAADSTVRVYATANGQAGSTLTVTGRCGSGGIAVARDGQAYLQTSTHIVALAGPSPCPAGQARQGGGGGGGGACAPCPAGSHATAGGLACVLCPAGTYSSSAGSTSCDLCPDYLYSGQAGATSCSECPVNTEAEAATYSRVDDWGVMVYSGADQARGSMRCAQCYFLADAVRGKGEPYCHRCTSATIYDPATQTCKLVPQVYVSAALCALYGAFTLVTLINIIRGTGWGIFKAEGATARAVLSFIVMQTVDQVSDTLFLSSLDPYPVRYFDTANLDAPDWFNRVFVFIILPPLAQLMLTAYPAILAFARRKVLLFKEHKSPEAFVIDGLLFIGFGILVLPFALIYACMHASNFFVWRPFVDAVDRLLYGHTRGGDMQLHGPLQLLDTRELTRTALLGALTESVPQLVLQIWIAQKTKQATWQLYFSAALSTYMIFRSLFQAVYSMAMLKIPFHSLDFYFDAEKAVKDGVVAPSQLGKVAAAGGAGQVASVSSSEVIPVPDGSASPSAFGASTSTVITGVPPGNPQGTVTYVSPGSAPDPATPLPPLPVGWLEVRDPSGPTYYTFLATGRSQYERPGVVQPPLPKGWLAAKDPVGRAFYVDTRTGAAQFARPVLPPTPTTASGPSSAPAPATAKAESQGPSDGQGGGGAQEGGPSPQGTMLALRALSATHV